MPATPPVSAIASIVGPSTRITRRVDIYEEDAVTPFLLDAPVTEGAVSVDGTRSERRTIDVSFENIDGDLDNYPGGFWYDKVLKVFRGVQWDGLTPSYIQFTGASYLLTADVSSHNLTTTDLSARVGAALSDWTPALVVHLIGKWHSATNNRQWLLRVGTTGALEFFYSTTGANSIGFTSTVTLQSVLPMASYDKVYVGVDFTTNNGAGGKTVNFLYSLDGLGYVPLGDSVTEATTGTTGLFDANVPLTIGGSPDGAAFAQFRIYSAQVYDDTRTITDIDFTNLTAGQSGILDELGAPWVFSDAISRVAGGVYAEQSWETQVGEFIIDRIDTQHFPHTTKVSGRDYTKKLMEAQFTYTTTFAEGEPIEEVIQTIAINGGIDKYLLPFTGEELGRDFTFEAQASRWDAIHEIAQAYGYDVYFDQQGYLVMQVFQDPVSSPTIYTFETGEYGNLAAFGKSVTDTRIYNQIVVRGEATDILPVTAVAENHEPSSPTSIENLNRIKTYNYTSAFITTQAQADAVAAKFLAVHALEQFEVSLTSLVIPWLEALNIVEFIDPDPNPGDPDRFLLASFTIPLSLGTMTAQARRVTVVG